MDQKKVYTFLGQTIIESSINGMKHSSGAETIDNIKHSASVIRVHRYKSKLCVYYCK